MSADLEQPTSVWKWIRGLVALGLFTATIVVAFCINAGVEPQSGLTTAACFLLAAFLAWLLWLPPQKIDRFWLLWQLAIALLLAGGIWGLVSP
jgi:hypothetical protein